MIFLKWFDRILIFLLVLVTISHFYLVYDIRYNDFLPGLSAFVSIPIFLLIILIAGFVRFFDQKRLSYDELKRILIIYSALILMNIMVLLIIPLINN